ncbi:MAG: glycosyltransferase family 2 protein [Acetobacteraceae bacterium]
MQSLGLGVLLYVPSHTSELTGLLGVTLKFGAKTCILAPATGMAQISTADTAARSASLLARSFGTDHRQHLWTILNRRRYAGVDTLADLSWPIFLVVDSVYLCPPSGLVLNGWMADPFFQVRSLRLRSGSAVLEIRRETYIATSRPDVVETFGQQYGFTTEDCGFIVHAPDIYTAGRDIYLEVETLSGDIAYYPVQPPKSSGLPAIKALLDSFDLRYDTLMRGYDQVIGPAVAAMNKFHMETQLRVTTLAFGEQVSAPRSSIIVPLYGRVDFMEYQLAFFSESLAADHELIYVLDDPKLLRQAEDLAASCLARFRRAFKLVVLSHNVGYGRASNVGLLVAQGADVCFLHSDVFPHQPNWLEFMIETLHGNERVGAVGAVLLFEDGTVQHQGCVLTRRPEFGGLPVCLHPRKGRYPEDTAEIRKVPALTGACLVMSRERAVAMGGFDAGYVIGNFEDVDLCRRLQKAGLDCVVDHRASLYHLERQSQAAQHHRWKKNLTLYNAWLFKEKWGWHG